MASFLLIHPVVHLSEINANLSILASSFIFIRHTIAFRPLKQFYFLLQLSQGKGPVVALDTGVTCVVTSGQMVPHLLDVVVLCFGQILWF